MKSHVPRVGSCWPHQGRVTSRAGGFLALAIVLTTPTGMRAATWAEEALQREADFIVNCSLTEHTINHAITPLAHPDLDAYGAINYDRVAGWGADWVMTGDAALAAIGLMAASRQLAVAGREVRTYEEVLNKFFAIWLVERRQGVNTNADEPDFGAIHARVHYDRRTGRWVRNEPGSTLATGKMIVALWKFYEHHQAMKRAPAATQWLRRGWPVAREAGNYLQRVYDPQYRLVRESSVFDRLGLQESAWAVAALRCLDRWNATLREPAPFDYARLADDLVAGLQAMKDTTQFTNFFRVRESVQGFEPSYGGSIDTVCFAPYAVDVLDAGDPFCRAISDWWTHGGNGVQMTMLPADTNDWRYYGTRVRAYLDGRRDYRLGARATLELARIEWKHWRKTGDLTMRERARQRLQWVANPACGSLWFGATGQSELSVPNGVLDWRDAQEYDRTPPAWSRFCDVSAYFIETVLMLHYNVDTRFIPELVNGPAQTPPVARGIAAALDGGRSPGTATEAAGSSTRTARKLGLIVLLIGVVLALAVLAWRADRSRLQRRTDKETDPDQGSPPRR